MRLEDGSYAYEPPTVTSVTVRWVSLTEEGLSLIHIFIGESALLRQGERVSDALVVSVESEHACNERAVGAMPFVRCV